LLFNETNNQLSQPQTFHISTLFGISACRHIGLGLRVVPAADSTDGRVSFQDGRWL